MTARHQAERRLSFINRIIGKGAVRVGGTFLPPDTPLPLFLFRQGVEVKHDFQRRRGGQRTYPQAALATLGQLRGMGISPHAAAGAIEASRIYKKRRVACGNPSGALPPNPQDIYER